MAGPLESVRSALRVRAPVLQDPGPDGSFAAVALVLVTTAERELEALLIRRAIREDDPWSGHVALPGGRQHSADADLLATARRETLEEIGLDLTPGDLLGQLDDLRPTTRVLPAIVVRPYVFGLALRPPVRPNGEVAGHLWTPLAALRSQRVPAQVPVSGALREVVGLRMESDFLWGITLRILDGLLERLAEPPKA
jgi:8-oxo-dGTP pyrophosphatase MutT (NUDIX family)